MSSTVFIYSPIICDYRLLFACLIVEHTIAIKFNATVCSVEDLLFVI